MKSDILLMYPPHDVDVRYIESIPTLDAYLTSKGHKVDVYQGKLIDDIVDHIKTNWPRFIGISVPFTFMGKNARAILCAIKVFFPGIPIVMGGAHATLCSEEYSGIADYVCVGDGEEYLNLLLSGFEPEVVNLSLDDIPLPNWRKPPYDILVTGEEAYPYLTSRGCPYACGFCSNWLLSNRKVRYKSIDRVIHDLQHYIKQGITCFAFRDETFTVDTKRVHELCHKIMQKGINITWWAQTRAGLIDDETIRVMKSAGCIGLSIGVESGNNDVLKHMNKQITKQQVKDGIRIIKKYGLLVYSGYMVGHPWDTIDTIKETIEFADETQTDYAGYSITIPYPGTRYHTIAYEHGGIKTTDYSKYRTPYVVYVTPNLRGYDMIKLKHYAEQWFYTKSLSYVLRRAKEIFLKKGIKPKIHGVLIFTKYVMKWLKRKMTNEQINLERCKK